MLVVQVTSAGFDDKNQDASVCINREQVEIKVNENGNLRGLHIVVASPDDGAVVKAQAYDTHESSEELEKFISEEMAYGSIVVAACQDECSKNLSEKVKEWFQRMGSKEI